MNIININNPKLDTIACEVLKSGGIIIYPTETCYGVGVDATNNEAVSKVLKYKKRPEGKAISIACTDMQMAKTYVEINHTAENIYQNFLPGPITVISKSKHIADSRLESESGTLGIRVPAYPKLLELIKHFGKPITSTSANSAGKKTPYKIEDIFNNISKKQLELIDLIIDAGELPQNPPSTVIDTTSEDLTVYRQGAFEMSNNNILSENISDSVEETIKLGVKIITQILEHIDLTKSPAIILLNGQMGAGKTHLTKGIAKALGITRTVKSPTYNYVDEYSFTLKSKIQREKNSKVTPANRRQTTNTDDRKLITHNYLYHIDAWRIKTKEDLESLEFGRYLQPGNIVVIEWPEVIEKLNPDLLKNYFRVDIKQLSQDKREILVTS